MSESPEEFVERLIWPLISLSAAESDAATAAVRTRDASIRAEALEDAAERFQAEADAERASYKTLPSGDTRLLGVGQWQAYHHVAADLRSRAAEIRKAPPTEEPR